jgi:hypothetical protein
VSTDETPSGGARDADPGQSQIDTPSDRGQPDTRSEVDPDVATLLGLRPAGAGDVPDADELDDLGQMTDTAVYEGELASREPGSDQPDEERLESILAEEARAGETDNPDEAAEEGLTWVPPTDPPVIASDAPGGAEVAAGFGVTAEDEPFDADHHGEVLPADDERTARVEEALRADARTSTFADDLIVDSDGGLVRLEGVVADLDDEDAAIAVAEEVPGVTDVVSEIVVEALEGSEPG